MAPYPEELKRNTRETPMTATGRGAKLGYRGTIAFPLLNIRDPPFYRLHLCLASRTYKPNIAFSSRWQLYKVILLIVEAREMNLEHACTNSKHLNYGPLLVFI